MTSTPDVVVLLPADPAVPDPWIAGAVGAVAQLRAAGADVAVQVGIPDRIPEARIVLCHGVQYADLLRIPTSARVIVSDLLPTPPVGPITMVDWCWAESAATAGTHAAALGADIGFVAGPSVPTQQRVLAAFTASAVRGGGAVVGLHLPSFGDRDAGRRSGIHLVGLGCRVVGHSADAAGMAATEAARERGAVTFGFLEPADGDQGWIRSDVAGALGHLSRRALDGEELPAVFAADAASGFGSFEVR